MWKKVKPNGEQVIANTPTNREKLAQAMVDSWDMKDLVDYAVYHVYENLENCSDEEFEGEWKDFYQED